MKIGIIGAGKVGTTLGKYLSIHGVPVVGYYSRSDSSAAAAAEFTETEVYHTLRELASASDTLFITTPDGEIGGVWDCIRDTGLSEKIICHFSGSLSSHVFSGIEQTGASGCSIHPMYAFGGRFTSYQQFHTAMLTMEGQREAVEKMRSLFGDRLRHRILPIRTEDKMKYHAAAALASNYMVGLFEVSLTLLGECGFSEEDARSLLRPLLEANIGNMLEEGTQASLTGPVERNDVETVEKHLQVLGSSNTEIIYRELGKVLASLAERKNPGRDYSQMRQLLEQGLSERNKK